MAEIAVFGGTFDPPTRAHEGIIEACLTRTDIDEVWVMPSGVRADKPGMAQDETRLELLRLLKIAEFDNDPRLVISDFELNLPRPTQTAATVSALQNEYFGHNFWFVFGADSYGSMHIWEDGERLKHNLGMLLVGRVGYELPEEAHNIKHLDAPGVKEMGLSSTVVREAVRYGKPVSHHVSPVIEEHIMALKMYRAVQ